MFMRHGFGYSFLLAFAILAFAACDVPTTGGEADYGTDASYGADVGGSPDVTGFEPGKDDGPYPDLGAVPTDDATSSPDVASPGGDTAPQCPPVSRVDLPTPGLMECGRPPVECEGSYRYDPEWGCLFTCQVDEESYAYRSRPADVAANCQPLGR